jgi:hypothetical protein
MAIFYAAPFLFAAGLAFTILSVIRPLRRWAIPIPTGVITCGPCLIVTLILSSALAHFVAPNHLWSGWFAASFLGLAGLAAVLGGIIAGLAAWVVASHLPVLLLRCAVFIAAWCSYFVLIYGLGFLINMGDRILPAGWIVGLLIFVFNALLSFIAAWFTARNSESYRPGANRLANVFPGPSWLQSRANRGSAEKLQEMLSRVPDVPPDSGDQL